VASGLYNSARAAFLKADIDWETADLRCLLVDDGYTFDPTDVMVSDLPGAVEINATDYSRQVLTGLAVTGTSPTYADADPIVFAGLGGVVNDIINGAVIYVHNASPSLAALVCFVDTTDILTQDVDTTIVFADSHVFNWVG